MSGYRSHDRAKGITLRKYLFSGAMLSAVFGGWSTVKMTRQGPRDWRLILMWVRWGLSIAIAVGSVLENAREADELEEKS